MRIVDPDEFIRYKEKAISIVKDIDIDDVLFFACVLAYKDSFIWSNDKRLKTQKIVRVLNTTEVFQILLTD